MKPETGPHAAGGDNQPTKEDLQRFMAGGLSPEESKVVVRHLLRGCPACIRETRRLWNFGEELLCPLLEADPLSPREAGLWR